MARGEMTFDELERRILDGTQATPIAEMKTEPADIGTNAWEIYKRHRPVLKESEQTLFRVMPELQNHRPLMDRFEHLDKSVH